MKQYTTALAARPLFAAVANAEVFWRFPMRTVAFVISMLFVVSAKADTIKTPTDGKYTTRFSNPSTNVVEGCGDLVVREGKYYYKYRPKCGKNVTFAAEAKAGFAPRFGNARFEIESVSGRCIKGTWHRYRSAAQSFCR